MKNHRRLNSKSKLYLWNLITVAVFYSLPVVQLVFTFQKVIFVNILYVKNGSLKLIYNLVIFRF